MSSSITSLQVREDEQTIKAVETMVSNNVGSVVVRSSETQLHVGLLSRLDCMRKLVLQQRFARETPVRDIMNDNVRIECPPPITQLNLNSCTLNKPHTQHTHRCFAWLHHLLWANALS